MLPNKKIWLVPVLLVCGFQLLQSQTESTEILERDIKKEERFINAKLLSISGKKSDAIKLLDSLRKENPDDAAIQFELAKLYRDSKDVIQTEIHLKEAVRLAPDNIWIRTMEAEYAEYQGRFQDACQIIGKICQLAPKNPTYYQWKTDLHLKGNDVAGALQTLDNEALQIGFREKTVLRKAEILENAGKLDEAIQVLESLNNRFPSEKKYLRVIINLLHANDKVQSTIPFLKRILAIDTNDSDAKLGLILLENKKLNKEDYLVTLVPLIGNPDAPVDMKIKELLPFVSEQSLSGDTVLAGSLIKLCDQLIQVHPKEAKAHAIYADILKNNGNLEAAVRQYNKTLELSRKNFLVWEQLMFCLYILKDYEQLLTKSQEAIDYFPNQTISYWFAAESNIAMNNTGKAMSLLEEAGLIAAGNSEMESRILASEAKISMLSNKFDKAEQIALESHRLSNGKNSIASELLGDIYFEKKQFDLARNYWNEAIQTGGNVSVLQSKLKKLP